MNANSILTHIGAAAVLVLGFQLATACGSDTTQTEQGDPATNIGKVFGRGSADAVERREADTGSGPYTEGNPRGSADAQERRMAVERGASRFVSPHISERLGHSPWLD